MKRSLSNGKRARTEDSGSPVLELIPNEIKEEDKEIVMSGNLIIYMRVQETGTFSDINMLEGYVRVKPNEEQDVMHLEKYDQTFYVLWTRQHDKENIRMRITERFKEEELFEPKYHILYNYNLTDHENEKDPKQYIAFYIMKEKEYIRMCNYEIRNHIELLPSNQSSTCMIYLNPEHTTEQTGEKMIKRLKKDNNFKYISWYMNELKIYQELAKQPHPNICTMYGLKIIDNDEGDGGSIFPGMVLEQGVDFRNVVSKLERIYDKESNIKEYYLKMEEFIDQMINGLKYFHELGYIHFDVKLENYILSGDKVKLIDFGMTEKREGLRYSTEMQIKCTEGYAPIETQLIRREYANHFDERVDVWSLGICILLMLGRDAYSLDMLDRINHRVFKPVLSWKMDESQEEMDKLIDESLEEYEDITGHRGEIKELLKRMLRVDPKDRTKLENVRTPVIEWNIV